MKSLIDLYRESTDTKQEINVLIAESNNLSTPLETRLSLLARITTLHQKLNDTLHEIRQCRLVHS